MKDGKFRTGVADVLFGVSGIFVLQQKSRPKSGSGQI
jgi:hypothetical protein